MTEIQKELSNTVHAKHSTYDWGWHQLDVIKACYLRWEDRNGVVHRIDGFDEQNLLERIKAL